MKRLITILAVISLVCLGAEVSFGAWPAGTEFMPPGPYADYVDIGDHLLPDDVTVNTSSTEALHNLQGWGAIQPIWSVTGNYGGMAAEGGHCRPMQHIINNGDGTYSTTGVAYVNGSYDYTDPYFNETGTPNDDYCGDPWATLDLNVGPAGGTKTVYIRYLDGGGGANGDNFDVFIDAEGTPRLQITTQGSPETWELGQFDVSDLTGTVTVKFVSNSPTSSFTPQYGLTCIDKVGVVIENVPPTITPVAADGDPINCSGTKTVAFHYNPGSAPDVRGYTVRVACDAPLTFDDTDVAFATLPSGASVQHYVREVTAGQVYDLDYVVLGGSVGIDAEADLFSVTFHGAGTGTGTVSIVSADLRDLVGTPITPVVIDGTASIPVDCDPPTGVFFIDPGDPDYTNSVNVELKVSVADATAMRFTNIPGDWSLSPQNDWVVLTATHPWELLSGDGSKTVYGEFRDAAGNVLATSDGIELDTTAPATHVVPLGPYHIDSFFDVLYEIDVPGTDGDYDVVELFYKGPGVTDWTYYGDFVDTATPLQFETGPTGTNTGDGTYFFYSRGTDFAGNVEDPPVDHDATTTVDTSDLTINYFYINDDDTYTSSQLVTLSMDVPGATEMEFSNDGLTWSGYVAYAATLANWDLGAGEVTKTVYAHFKETSGRVTNAQDDIILDSTPPDGVSDLTASRGAEKVHLAWTNPGGDQTGVEIWRAVWHDGDGSTSVYPEYNDVLENTVPTVPADRAAALADPAWTAVDLSGATWPFATFTDLLPVRGIYYYVVYPVDSAGNYGAGDDASSISYLLGDVQDPPYDGLVSGSDITVLSLAYGKTEGVGEGYNNECDVGPTDDYSGSGIPTTDNWVDFDDLMVFALNWGIQLTKAEPAVGSPIARFSWVENDDASWSLVLAEPCANLKGVNLKAEAAPGANLTVVAGELLKKQENTYFLRNIPERGLDAGLALLGSGACITGRGELVRISLTGELDLEDIAIDARGADNKALEYSLEEAAPEADLPSQYMLSANYPNPFNPSTKIDFSLPESQHVKLAIYSIDGRLIATLKDESLSAGHYTVTWQGRDDQGRLAASGIYFYRIQAGDFSRMEKMTLLK